MIKVGILGAAGYTGGELIRLLINHPPESLSVLTPMMTRFGHICLLLLLSTTIESKAVSDHNPAAVCQVQKIELEQLPDLNISRAGHQVFCINGEYVVAGGHTNGFVPTPTAEYFKDAAL